MVSSISKQMASGRRPRMPRTCQVSRQIPPILSLPKMRHSCPDRVSLVSRRGARSGPSCLGTVFAGLGVMRSIRCFVLLAMVWTMGAAGCGSDPATGVNELAEGTSCQTEGATAAAADGCNVCTCAASRWQCTTQVCSSAGCPPPAPTDTSVVQPTPTWARNSASGACCRYDDASVAPYGTDWAHFFSQIDCESLPCSLNTTIPAGDGCNYCTCDGNAASGWSCSDNDCQNITAPSSGKQCGYWQGDCPANEYCAYLPGADCGEFDVYAYCRAVPTQCTEEDAPVCGCHGKTYKNRCLAAEDGNGVMSVGPCPEDASPSCGGKSSVTCPADQYCPYRAGDGCGNDGTESVCAPRPAACVSYLDPVCGCDKKVYGNSCLAAIAGVGVLQSGACP